MWRLFLRYINDTFILHIFVHFLITNTLYLLILTLLFSLINHFTLINHFKQMIFLILFESHFIFELFFPYAILESLSLCSLWNLILCAFFIFYGKE